MNPLRQRLEIIKKELTERDDIDFQESGSAVVKVLETTLACHDGVMLNHKITFNEWRLYSRFVRGELVNSGCTIDEAENHILDTQNYLLSINAFDLNNEHPLL